MLMIFEFVLARIWAKSTVIYMHCIACEFAIKRESGRAKEKELFAHANADETKYSRNYHWKFPLRTQFLADHRAKDMLEMNTTHTRVAVWRQNAAYRVFEKKIAKLMLLLIFFDAPALLYNQQRSWRQVISLSMYKMLIFAAQVMFCARYIVMTQIWQRGDPSKLDWWGDFHR